MTRGDEPPAGARDAQRGAPAGFQLITPAAWQAALQARRRRRTCNVLGCGQTGRLYPAGFRCDEHRPRAPDGDAA